MRISSFQGVSNLCLLSNRASDGPSRTALRPDLNFLSRRRYLKMEPRKIANRVPVTAAMIVINTLPLDVSPASGVSSDGEESKVGVCREGGDGVSRDPFFRCQVKDKWLGCVGCVTMHSNEESPCSELIAENCLSSRYVRSCPGYISSRNYCPCRGHGRPFFFEPPQSGNTILELPVLIMPVVFR